MAVKCLVCGRERDEQAIVELMVDMGGSSGSGKGHNVVRLKFCGDVTSCMDKAEALRLKNLKKSETF